MNQAPPKIYGLIGHPVKHSLSPVMHNAAFKHLKDTGEIDYNAEYRLFDVKPRELEEFLLNPEKIVKDTNNNTIRAGDILGFNITIPHKVRAREILGKRFPFDKSAPLMLEVLHYVKTSGAINTVRRAENKLEYFNTDATGFLKSLETDLKFNSKGKNVIIIGCGGAGRAIIAALSWKQAGIKKIFINDIKNEAIESARKHFSQLPQFTYLKDKLQFISTEQISDKIKESDLLVNTSPIGMGEGDSFVIEKDLFHDGLSVYDVVYNRNRETQLVEDAKSLGLPAADGLRMLLHQGADAFEIWTGKPAPVEVMEQALQKQLTRDSS